MVADALCSLHHFLTVTGSAICQPSKHIIADLTPIKVRDEWKPECVAFVIFRVAEGGDNFLFASKRL